MSKKNYIVFARILKDAKTKAEVTEGLIDYLGEDNPRFDVYRFRRAITKI